MRVHAIIQARCGSSRFPSKVFAEIDGKPLIWHVVNRLKLAKTIDQIIVATTVNPLDDALEQWCKENQVSCFRGNEADVLNRYYEAACAFPSDVVVRITADDPFKEPEVIDAVVRKVTDEHYDAATNNNPPSFPEGLDCEAFTFEALRQAETTSNDAFEREHVTQYFYHHPEMFKIANVSSDKQLSHLRWTIDTKADLEMVNAIYSHRAKSNELIRMPEILAILEQHPEICQINASVARSAMYK